MPDVVMPQLGETVTEGTIIKWLKSVGDAIARDEPLFEVSTDKVDSEVPSPAEGVLAEILVAEGDTVDVGARLAIIGDRVTATASSAAATASTATSSAAPEDPIELDASMEPEAPAPTGNGAGLVLSPVVRKLLDEHRIDPESIMGTGLGGRITRDDVEAVIGSGLPASAEPTPVEQPVPTEPVPTEPVVTEPVPTEPVVAMPAEPPRTSPVGVQGHDEVLPFTNIRRRTAEHMVRSKATSAHTLMVKEVDYERVEQVRRSHGERFASDEGFGLTYLPFAARATVEALREYPHLNASVGDDALVVHHDVNLGIAVDLDNEGLIVPVVHHAEELTLRGMARRIRELADRARTKRLGADDISDGTFSITNAGPFGTLLTGAIINQPQVAILSTDGVSRKPVVVTLPDGSESIAIHSVGLVAMNFDHRAVDGAYVARFLARMSEILNERDWAGEL